MFFAKILFSAKKKDSSDFYFVVKLIFLKRQYFNPSCSIKYQFLFTLYNRHILKETFDIALLLQFYPSNYFHFILNIRLNIKIAI